MLLSTGCRPPGARALLKGKYLLDQGQFERAAAQFQEATTLLPTNALAFNYLGLALHQSGRPAEAERAYYRALAINHELAEARYNLGCLFLSENRPEQARSELTAFTLQRPNYVDGWVKLGTAQLRSHEPAAAERSFNQALHLGPQDPECLTGIGLARLQRNRPAEAVQWFNNALKSKPDYAPALLNLAIVTQENLRDKALALQQYRRYLAIKPPAEDFAAVQKIAQQLESALATPPAAAQASAPTLTQKTATPALTTVAPQRSAPAIPSKPSVETTNAVASGRVPAQPEKAALANRAQSNGELAKVVPQTNAARPQTTSSQPKAVEASGPAKAAPARASVPPLLEVVEVPAEPVFRVAGDTPSRPASTPPPAAAAPANSAAGPALQSAPSKPPKRSLLSKLNPVRIFSSDDSSSPATTARNSEPGTRQADTEAPLSAKPPEQTPKAFARYAYLSPAKPAAGNRSEAEQVYAPAVKAQQARRLTDAIQGYRRATELDPSFFDARYNLGVAAAEAGDLPAALAAYEHALAVRPDSLDARYNFALALKQADFPIDARNELEKLLRAYPNETRAHLALGNLYAQQFRDPAKAREHYLKVLEAEPMHPQAGAIRYWLTANPAR